MDTFNKLQLNRKPQTWNHCVSFIAAFPNEIIHGVMVIHRRNGWQKHILLHRKGIYACMDITFDCGVVKLNQQLNMCYFQLKSDRYRIALWLPESYMQLPAKRQFPIQKWKIFFVAISSTKCIASSHFHTHIIFDTFVVRIQFSHNVISQFLPLMHYCYMHWIFLLLLLCLEAVLSITRLQMCLFCWNNILRSNVSN